MDSLWMIRLRMMELLSCISDILNKSSRRPYDELFIQAFFFISFKDI